jgi:hypothetical protein
MIIGLPQIFFPAIGIHLISQEAGGKIENVMMSFNILAKDRVGTD